MPTAADFDKALHREIGAVRHDPGRHHRRRLAAGARARAGRLAGRWPTLAALIETPGSAVQAMGEVAAGLEIDADALQANMRRSALAVGRRSDRLDPSDNLGGNK